MNFKQVFKQVFKSEEDMHADIIHQISTRIDAVFIEIDEYLCTLHAHVARFEKGIAVNRILSLFHTMVHSQNEKVEIVTYTTEFLVNIPAYICRFSVPIFKEMDSSYDKKYGMAGKSTGRILCGICPMVWLETKNRKA